MMLLNGNSVINKELFEKVNFEKNQQMTTKALKMKKVNKQCLLDTPRTVRVSEKTWQVIVQTRRP